jgi:Raf kinase inhibitor-like YbhB/YbcL family protein
MCLCAYVLKNCDSSESLTSKWYTGIFELLAILFELHLLRKQLKRVDFYSVKFSIICKIKIMQKSILILVLLSAFSFYAFGQSTFTLKSKDVGGEATKTQEFNGFGCTGENTSPQLSWTNAPEGTKSFAITMYDKDAPTGSGWWHWVVFDIPANVHDLAANAGNIAAELAPDGAIQSLTNYGVAGYGGPCPPEGHGLHQYVITVHALKIDKLGLDENTNPAIVGYYLGNNTLAKASIVMYYERAAK